MNHRLISSTEAALLHQVKPATIRSWVRRGLLAPALRVGQVAYYRVADVDEAEYQARKRDVSGRSAKRTG